MTTFGFDDFAFQELKGVQLDHFLQQQPPAAFARSFKIQFHTTAILYWYTTLAMLLNNLFNGRYLTFYFKYLNSHEHAAQRRKEKS